TPRSGDSELIAPLVRGGGAVAGAGAPAAQTHATATERAAVPVRAGRDRTSRDQLSPGGRDSSWIQVRALMSAAPPCATVERSSFRNVIRSRAGSSVTHAGAGAAQRLPASVS